MEKKAIPAGHPAFYPTGKMPEKAGGHNEEKGKTGPADPAPSLGFIRYLCTPIKTSKTDD
jgi:hypothetical protein